MKHIIHRSTRIKKEIHQLYCPRLDRRTGFGLITSGLIFASVSADQGLPELQPLLESTGAYHGPQNPVSFESDVDDQDVEAIFPFYSREVQGYFSPEMAQDLRCWLEEPDMERMARRPLRLDECQFPLVTTRTKGGYRRLKGPAGSGKSLVLAARAAHLSSKAENVLVVTYNITLIHYLRSLAFNKATFRSLAET